MDITGISDKIRFTYTLSAAVSSSSLKKSGNQNIFTPLAGLYISYRCYRRIMFDIKKQFAYIYLNKYFNVLYLIFSVQLNQQQ
jgi:hypothetical protein